MNEIDKGVVKALLDIGPTFGLPDVWELSGSKAAGEDGMKLHNRIKILVTAGIVKDTNKGYAVTAFGAARYRKLCG